jgi:hypothetical protein
MIYDYRRQDRSQAKMPWLPLKRHRLEKAGFGVDDTIRVWPSKRKSPG